MSEIRAGVAVIGDADTIAGFPAAGFDTFEVADVAALDGIWDAAVGGAYAVVFVTDAAVSLDAERFEKLETSTLPAVTVIPAAGSNGSTGRDKMRRAVARALGTVIDGDEKE